MKKQEFLKLIRSKITFLDGATGTELAKLGMPHGVCPEAWVIEHPDSIATIQKNYEAAGSDIVYACTFGANPVKLANYGFEKDTIAMNRPRPAGRRRRWFRHRNDDGHSGDSCRVDRRP